ncbi:MAG: YfcE family phosphodiesterase, partial [Cetobacterium sp.]
AVIFCGDVTDDAEELSYVYKDIPFVIVKGNCDYYDRKNEEEILLELMGKKILVTHGHLYQVKQGYIDLEIRTREVGADIALFGHTHRPYLKEGEVILFNPGAVVNGEYGIIDISEEKVGFVHKKFKLI